MIGSPVLAATAPEVFAGTLYSRLASSTADVAIQYSLLMPQYGFGLDNLKRLNLASVAGNFIAPGSSFGASLIGNSFAVTAMGEYKGIGNTMAGNFGFSVALGYEGNVFESGLGNLAEKYVNGGAFLNNFAGNIFGNWVSGTGQVI